MKKSTFTIIIKPISWVSALLLSTSAPAAITSTGNTYLAPNYANTWVGYSSNGSLLIDGDSDYSTNALSVGQLASVTGAITVSGAGSTLTTNQSVYVGSAGNGSININSGAIMTSSGLPSYPSYYGVVIGNGSGGAATGGTGSVTVDGAGSQWIVPDMGITVGANNPGSFTVSNGGTLQTGGGVTVNSGGSLLVTGTDPTTHAASTLNTGGFIIYSNSSASSVISAGGIFNSTTTSTGWRAIGAAGVGASGPAAMTVTGAGSQMNITGGALVIGMSSLSGSLTVADGALVSVSLANSALGTGDGLITVGAAPSSSNAGTPPSVGKLYIGTGGAAGQLNVAGINGYSGVSGSTATPADSTLIFNHNETAYQFTNTAGTGILVSGDTRVVLQAGATIFTAANTYGGGTQITGGRLIVENIAGSGTGSGSVSVGAAGALGGSGIIVVQEAGGGILIAGTLSPGNPAASASMMETMQAMDSEAGALRFYLTAGAHLTFDPGSTLELNLAGGGASDSVQFLTKPGADAEWLSGADHVSLALDLSGADPYAQTYVIFDDAIADSAAGLFMVAAITGYDSANYTAHFSQSGNDYVLSFSPVAVPEPSICALLAVALGTITLRRRNRFAGKNISSR